jgi:hypothetical protein
MSVLPPPVSRSFAAGLGAAQSLLLVVLPQGGQQAARRNAWSGMARDARLARAHRDAGRAMDRAVAAAAQPAARASAR